MRHEYPYPPRWSDHPRRKHDTAPSGVKSGVKRERPAPKRRRVRRASEIRQARQMALVALYGVLAVELIVLALTSPVVGVKKVEVRGLEGLAASEAAAVTQIVTLPPSTNWLRAPVGPLANRLKSLPCLETVSLSRRLPDRLEAVVRPRLPAVVVEIGEQKFEVDGNGVPVRLARAEMVSRLPRITLPPTQTLQMGTPIQNGTLPALLQMAAEQRGALIPRIAKIEVDRNDNICLNMEDKIRVELGQVEDLPRKIALVQRLYDREPGIAQRLTAINLSCPDWPACTPRRAQPSSAPTPPAPAGRPPNGTPQDRVG